MLHKYGDLRMQRREWKDALTLYEAILRDQRQTLPPSESAEIAMQIGACHLELGNPERAFAAYQEAKALRSDLPPGAGRAGGGVRGEGRLGGVGGGAARARRRRRARGEAGHRGGDRRRLRRAGCPIRSAPRRATAPRWTWRPGGARRCTSCWTLYTKQGRWQPAIDLLNQLAKVEEDPAVRARTLYTAALILRDELNQPDEAASLLERCLDESPRPDRRVRGSGGAAQGEGDWKALARQLPPHAQAPARARRTTRFASACGRAWATSRSSACTIASWRWRRSRRRRRWSPATRAARRRWPTSTSCPGPTRASRRSPRTRSCSRAIRTAPIRTARSRSCTATATRSTSSGASPRPSTT